MTYPGGKGGCFRQIINRMPPHRVYIETHLGGGAVMRHKRPALRSVGIDIDHDVIETWVHRWPRRYQRPIEGGEGVLELVHDDAREWLERCDWSGGELVYADPPYPRSARRSGKRYYRHEYTDEDHVELLDTLKGLGCSVMISGYRCDLYDRELRGWRREDFHVATRGPGAIESLWMNFEPGALHEYTHLGGDFRERERIRRKQKRWAARLKGLPELEREAMLRTLLLELPPAVAVKACTDVYGEEDLLAGFGEASFPRQPRRGTLEESSPESAIPADITGDDDPGRGAGPGGIAESGAPVPAGGAGADRHGRRGEQLIAGSGER